ncbi:MAG: hypothetical protein JNL40_06365 [Cyclobacteriaceae bacterium]|nr:hypothetical protein [Cyclobacteriaceae bacterium]
MKKAITCWAILSLIGSLVTQAQDTLRTVSADTSGIVTVAPYYQLDLRTSNSYVSQWNYASDLKLSSGVSIFNGLRGKVPGLTIPAYVDLANASGLRTGPSPFVNDALLVIDGVPFNNEIGNYRNLNAFDYASIAVFSNTNALSFLGGTNSGAFVLNSKSGEGMEKPLLEFNAYATYAWEEVKDFATGLPKKISEWSMANSFAYGQDFGKLDTRIAYTLQKKYGRGFAEPYIHYLKANTGWALSPRFNLRLIIDGRYSTYDDTSPSGAAPSPAEKAETTSYISGNLVARFKINEWLSLTSQLSTWSYFDHNTLTGVSFGTDSKNTNSYQQANLLANVARQLGKVNLSGLAGYQVATQDIHGNISTYGPFPNSSESAWSDRYPYFLGQAGFTYADRFNMSGHFREGTHNNSSNNNTAASARSAGFSLIFTDWIARSFLTLGKLRASVGSHTVVAYNSYPIPDLSTYYKGTFRSFPYDVHNQEVGLDLGFLHSRLLPTLNYYQNEEKYFDNPNIGNQITNYKTGGWETDIRFNAWKTAYLTYQTGIVLSSSTSQLQVDGVSQSESKAYTRVGWNNQLKFKALQINLLIESYQNYTGYASNTGFVDASFTLLRDLSFSFNLPATTLFGLETRSMTVSVIGRNLLKFGGSGPDIDVASGLSVFRKSASVNLNITF